MVQRRLVSYMLALSCLAIAGLTAPAAKADHGQPFQSATLTRYLQIAETHWGAPAPTCPGPDGQAIPVHAVLFDAPHPDVTAMAELPGCRIWLDRDFWPAPEHHADCIIIAHEWGHLLGHGHSDDERHLMYEAPELGAPGCGVFAEAVPPPAANGRKRRSAARSKKKRAGRHCVRRGKAARHGVKPGRRSCNRRARNTRSG